ncbi:MAG: flagellar hook-length control protein FliK [Candidatus Sumerlaeota bacterium]
MSGSFQPVMLDAVLMGGGMAGGKNFPTAVKGLSGPAKGTSSGVESSQSTKPGNFGALLSGVSMGQKASELSGKPPMAVRDLMQFQNLDQLDGRVALFLILSLKGIDLAEIARGSGSASELAKLEEMLAKLGLDGKGKKLEENPEWLEGLAGFLMQGPQNKNNAPLPNGSNPKMDMLKGVMERLQAMMNRMAGRQAGRSVELAGTEGGDWQALGNALLRSQSAAREADIPDLVAFQSKNKISNTHFHFQSALPRPGQEMLLVSTPGSASNETIESLQSLMQQLRNGSGQWDNPTTSDEELAEINAFLASRFDTMTAASDMAAISENRLQDSIRQVQAVIQNMVDRMHGEVHLDTTTMRATIHLEPPALGRVHVQLSIDDMQNVEAHVSADSDEARDFLQQHEGDLRDQLAEQGFDRDGIKLEFGEEEIVSFDQLVEGAQII